MPDLFYRFRSIENLLDRYNELTNQEIYFAAPEELNDPIEGFRDVYWLGDAVVWKNILKHYLLCLEHCCSLMMLAGDTHRLSGKDIPVFKTPEDLPTQLYKDLYVEICENFFKACPPAKSSESLAARKKPVRRRELAFHLSYLHRFALDAISTVYYARGFTKEKPLPPAALPSYIKPQTLPEIINLLNMAEEEHPDISDVIETLCSAQKHVLSQLELMQFSKSVNNTDFNRLFIVSQFPHIYVETIEKIVYPEWYAACFMTECNNSSVWGHYADNHKGVCLIFQATREHDRLYLGLNRLTSWGKGGPSKGTAKHDFYMVDYQKKHAEVDFFRSLGRLPIGVIKKYWYTGQPGATSICSEDVFLDEKSWRNQYWEKFYHGVTTKLQEWKYEKEARLLLASSMFDFSDPTNRKLKYNFADLTGIIFGIRTPLEDKLRIAEIIETKCRNEARKDFKFYQAYYSQTDGKIAHAELSLLRFTDPK